MNTTVFSENLKKFRIANRMTQEEVANALSVAPQTVSRWECATTLPDVMTLPVIAKLYGVTVDDLFKKHSVAYDNYAQRLSSVYEKSRDPEDFMRCALEYKKLMKGGELSIVDRWNYATIHHFMMRYCKDIALEWYDKAIADGPESNPHIYSRALSLRARLLNEIGRTRELLAEQKERCELNQQDVFEWETLVEIYILAKEYQEGYSVFRKAVEKYPQSWRLYIHGGELCELMQKYDEAFEYWDKAGEMGTYFYDEYYCKALCYEGMGEHQKAYNLYMEIAEMLRADNYDIEAEMAESVAKEIKQKIK